VTDPYFDCWAADADIPSGRLTADFTRLPIAHCTCRQELAIEQDVPAKVDAALRRRKKPQNEPRQRHDWNVPQPRGRGDRYLLKRTVTIVSIASVVA
jgi:hypothetical protein